MKYQFAISKLKLKELSSAFCIVCILHDFLPVLQWCQRCITCFGRSDGRMKKTSKFVRKCLSGRTVKNLTAWYSSPGFSTRNGHTEHESMEWNRHKDNIFRGKLQIKSSCFAKFSSTFIHFLFAVYSKVNVNASIFR